MAGSSPAMTENYSPGSRSPTQRRAGAGCGFAVVHRLGAFERAVERRQHAPLDEIEGRRLAVARARQFGHDLLEDASRPRPGRIFEEIVRSEEHTSELQ